MARRVGEALPEALFSGEAAQHRVDVDQVAQAVVELALVDEVGDAVDHQVFGARHADA
jgi:hypothetical protein